MIYRYQHAASPLRHTWCTMATYASGPCVQRTLYSFSVFRPGVPDLLCLSPSLLAVLSLAVLDRVFSREWEERKGVEDSPWPESWNIYTYIEICIRHYPPTYVSHGETTMTSSSSSSSSAARRGGGRGTSRGPRFHGPPPLFMREKFS